MTDKLLPFERPAPDAAEPEPTLVTREEPAGGGLSFTLTIGVEAIEREMAQARLSDAQLEELWSPPEEIDLIDPDGFLYADDDGPEDDS